MLQSTSPSSMGSTIQQPIPPVNTPVNASAATRIAMDPNGNPLENSSYWGTFGMSSCFSFASLLYPFRRPHTNNSSDSDSDEYEISLESIKVNFKDDYIGGGTQSSVFRGILNEKTIALKKLNRASEVDIRMLKALEHPNVIRTLGVSTKDICPCIIMEYCEQGGLFDVLQRRKVTKALFCKWSSEIADGMAYLHLKKVVHRDLKSANILVDKDDNTKICDFGSLYTFDKTFMPSVVMSFVGTSQYMAPEMMKSEPCSEKVDVWSFGIVLHELLTQEIPYKGIPSMAIMYGVGSGTLKLHVPKTVPQTAKLLFKLCFSKKPRNRPSFNSIASHLTNLQAEVAEMSEDAWTMRKQVWQKDIREEMSRSQNGNPAEEQNVKADELVKKRYHELRHAQEIREMYEKKVQRVDKMMRKILVIMEDINAKEMDLKLREQKMDEIERNSRAYDNHHRANNDKHEKRRSAPPANTCRVQKPMVVRAGSKTISGHADAEYNYDCHLTSSNYAIVSIPQDDDEVDADSEVEAMSARSSRSSSDEEYYGPRQRPSFTTSDNNSFVRSSTRHSVGLPPTSSSTIRSSPKSDRNSIPAFPSSQSDRNFQFNENNLCQQCIYFNRNSTARISGISADSGVCTSTLTLEETGQRLHNHFDNNSSQHGSPLYRNVEGRWSDGRIQTRRKPRRQSSRDSPFKNMPSKKEKHLSSPGARMGSAGASEQYQQHRSSRDLHAMRSMSMIESVEVAVEEDENGRLVILDDYSNNYSNSNIKPSPSYQEAINASNSTQATAATTNPINNRISALRSEFAESGAAAKNNIDEETVAAVAASIMCESSSTMVSSLERSLEQAVGMSDGLSDKESTLRAARSHFKTHRRTASNPIPAIVAETSTTESDNDNSAVYI